MLRQYETSLNQSDAAALLALYTTNAVVMTPNQPTLSGKPAIRKAYEGGAKVIKSSVKFDVLEVVCRGPGLGARENDFVRFDYQSDDRRNDERGQSGTPLAAQDRRTLAHRALSLLKHSRADKLVQLI